MKRITQKSIPSIICWLWNVAKGNRLQTTLNAIIGILDVTISLLTVYAMRHAIDVAAHDVEGDLIWAICFIGIITIADFSLIISSIWVRSILGIKAQNRMQQRMIERVIRSEWQSKATHHSGDIMNRLEGDVGTVVGFLTETLPSALSTLLLFTGAFVYLYSMDSMLALITIAIVPLCIVMSKFYVRKMRKLNRIVRDSDSQIQSVMQDIVQHMLVIKTLESDKLMVSRLKSSQQELHDNIVRRTIFSVMSNLTVNLGFSISYLFTFAWSAFRLSAGTLTFGGMTAFLQLVSRIQGPARSLAKLIPSSVAVLTAAERLMELEDIPEEKDGDAIEIEAPCEINLENVSFRYENDSPLVFDNFSCTFPAATATAVVGETGAGKTTLIRLLLALSHPTEGRVTIASAKHPERRDVMTHLHRCNFVYVPQGNTLMSGTIRENLLLGKPEATEEQITEALHQSCADFVMSLPDGLDTMCSEQGGGLSEGQAQRIAIARALLRDRPVMLFDEATAALDPETERQLLQNIMQTKQKTIIFITHRMAVCDYCQNVLHIKVEGEGQ
ncbi:MAG: ABC transporter ATP-binding protein [Bacteroidales bacterium]|nr:ABC transporter ATP-binding protein [Bacteroidales bacterium]MDY5448240.1 ABC transporter ATP-binding protein [Prevotella sp.]